MSGEPTNGTNRSTGADSEISLLDLLLVIARQRDWILAVGTSIVVLGLVYSLVAPSEYRSAARVVREAETEMTGGISGISGGLSALRGLGINLGGLSSGLAAEAFPNVLQSREVRLAVARDTFYFPDVERRMTYTEYVNQESGVVGTALKYVVRYTVGLPSRIVRLFEEGPSSAAASDNGDRAYPTEEEEEAIEMLEEQIGVGVDVETGILTIAVTASDPLLATEMTERVMHHFKERMRIIRTEKERQTLEFVRSRFAEAQGNLRAAEQRLAAFNDRNQSINTSSLRLERDRLQREVRFASDLYSEFQAQVTQAEIELQRSEPVITVLEQPAPPIQRAAPQRTLIMLITIVLAGIVSLGLAFARSILQDQFRDPEEQQKMKEIKGRLLPKRLRSSTPSTDRPSA